MQYTPTSEELEDSKQFTAAERMQYCMSRIVEGEEVWGLAEEEGWIINEVDQQDTLPIWPYKAFAWQCIPAKWPNAETQAVSLEHFV